MDANNGSEQTPTPPPEPQDGVPVYRVWSLDVIHTRGCLRFYNGYEALKDEVRQWVDWYCETDHQRSLHPLQNEMPDSFIGVKEDDQTATPAVTCVRGFADPFGLRSCETWIPRRSILGMTMIHQMIQANKPDDVVETNDDGSGSDGEGDVDGDQ